MATVNHYSKECAVKVVYYGPGLGGKTSSLQWLHHEMAPKSRGNLVQIATGGDRTLYFDFLPINLPPIQGYTVRVQLYTVPGQVHYNATRRIVLTGADGVIFVADSQGARRMANIESRDNLHANLEDHAIDPMTFPVVFQYNKRDIPDVMDITDMEVDLNPRGLPSFATTATRGTGLFDALKAIIRQVLLKLKREGLWDPDRKEELQKKARQISEDFGNREQSGLVASLQQYTTGEEELGSAIEATPSLTNLFQTAPSGAESEASVHATFSISQLWRAGSQPDVLAIEGEITRGDYAAAVIRAEGLLQDLLSRLIPDRTLTPVEASQITGVPYQDFLRFDTICKRSEDLDPAPEEPPPPPEAVVAAALAEEEQEAERPKEAKPPAPGELTIVDALFALHFLTQVELRCAERHLHF